jgi:hypothetical protein
MVDLSGTRAHSASVNEFLLQGKQNGPAARAAGRQSSSA